VRLLLVVEDSEVNLFLFHYTLHVNIQLDLDPFQNNYCGKLYVKTKCYSPAGEQSFVLFTGEYYFSEKFNEIMEIVFLLQYNLYRKKYEKYDNTRYDI
jgi:hypothetical protein